MVGAETVDGSSGIPLAHAIDPDFTVTEVWSTYETVVDEVVRRVQHTGGGLEPADLLQQAALIVAELLQTAPAAASTEGRFSDSVKRQLYRRIREYVRSERRRLGRQVSADENALDRALRRRAAAPGGPGSPNRAVARAIEALSPRQRSVIAALYFRDERVGTLASDLGITPQAVTALHRRALAALRHELDPAETRRIDLKPANPSPTPSERTTDSPASPRDVE